MQKSANKQAITKHVPFRHEGSLKNLPGFLNKKRAGIFKIGEPS